MAQKTKKGSKTKAEKPEVEETEDDDDELEELDEDEAETKPKKSKASDDDVAFGAADLAKLLSKKTGKTVSPRDLRTQLRRMARRGELDREIVAGNKARWSWSGPEDPEVKAIIKAVMSGEMEEAKKEQLAKLKEGKAAKDAKSKKDGAKKAKKSKAVVEDDDDEEEDEDDE